MGGGDRRPTGLKTRGDRKTAVLNSRENLAKSPPKELLSGDDRCGKELKGRMVNIEAPARQGLFPASSVPLLAGKKNLVRIRPVAPSRPDRRCAGPHFATFLQRAKISLSSAPSALSLM
jgi:hypothetical protein